MYPARFVSQDQIRYVVYFLRYKGKRYLLHPATCFTCSRGDGVEMGGVFRRRRCGAVGAQEAERRRFAIPVVQRTGVTAQGLVSDGRVGHGPREEAGMVQARREWVHALEARPA